MTTITTPSMSTKCNLVIMIQVGPRRRHWRGLCQGGKGEGLCDFPLSHLTYFLVHGSLPVLPHTAWYRASPASYLGKPARVPLLTEHPCLSVCLGTRHAIGCQCW